MDTTPSAPSPLNLFAFDFGLKDNPTALVFLHYFGGSGGEWEEIIPAFSTQFRCIAPDLRGHGASPDISDAHSVDDMASDVRLLLQTRGVTDCVLIGHSMGGKVALALASRPGENLTVRGMLLLAPSPPSGQPMSEDERRDTNEAWDKRDEMEKMLQNAAMLPFPPMLAARFVDDNLRVTKPAWDAWQNEGSQEDISSRMAGIEIPTLVLSGECDPVIAPDLLQSDLFARLSNARLETVPGAGHLTPFETPEAVVDALQTLLQNLNDEKKV